MILTLDEIMTELQPLKGWEYINASLRKAFEFETFIESMQFVNKLAPIAEEHDHHPDIVIQYKKVILTLSTHSEGAVTKKDIELARSIESIGN